MMSVCFNRSSRATLQAAARTTFQHRPEGLCFARAGLQPAGCSYGVLSSPTLP